MTRLDRVSALPGIDQVAKAARELDRVIEAAGVGPLWLGAEPTFTRRDSQDTCWLWTAEGGDKEERARALLLELAADSRVCRSPLLVRSIGRQYPGETRPRWSFGLWWWREEGPLPAGFVDPWLRQGLELHERVDARSWRDALADVIVRGGARVHCYDGPDSSARLAWRTDGGVVEPGEAMLMRASVHMGAVPESGLRDEAAERGVLVVALTASAEGDGVVVELPAFPSVDVFVTTLRALGAAAEHAAGRTGVVLCGFTPPVDERAAWLTVTPDPGVVEVNLAPARDLAEFSEVMGALYEAAARVGLSPLRYRYNGVVTDSGGGGQLTFGGPSALASPFFRHPHLLPGLLRYVNRHPALSYVFAMDCIGSASQGPRTDEGVRERFEELAVALDRLDVQAAREPQALWESLAPLLVDGSGNAHRAEVNVEKLWNPHLRGRGCLGVVELRALAMEATPARAVAVAGLWRALLARLARAPFRQPLIDWGAELHDRFALPWELAADLDVVLADLAAHGVALPAQLAQQVLGGREPLVEVELAGAHMRISRALEFWPLVGDVASQETRGARLVDSSTVRVEVRVTVADGGAPGLVAACGFAVDLRQVASDVHVAGVRYRAFVPDPGLHPGLAAENALRIVWERGGRRAHIALHEWIPGGGAYDGIPMDDREAARRRGERVVVRIGDADGALLAQSVPAQRRGAFTVDLRRLSLSAHIEESS